MDTQDVLGQYRSTIDELDQRIIGLLAERTAIVRELMVHKTDEDSVRGRDRVQQVIERVRKLALAEGMPADIAERTYCALIEALTDMQLEYLRCRRAAEQGRTGR